MTWAIEVNNRRRQNDVTYTTSSRCYCACQIQDGFHLKAERFLPGERGRSYRPLQEDPRPQCPTLISHPPAKRPAVSQQNPLLSEPFACGRIGSLDRLDLLFRWAAGATARGYVHSFDYSFVPDTKRKDVPIFGNALRRTWLSQQPSQTEAEAGRGLPATSTNVRNMWLRRFQISPVSPRGKPSPTVDRGRQSQKFSTE